MPEVTVHPIDQKYICFRGAWEQVPPGFQFKTTSNRVLGSLWKKEGIWYAQRYHGDICAYCFADRETAEFYVKAANEESSLLVLMKCI